MKFLIFELALYASRQQRESARVSRVYSCFGRLGKPVIYFFPIGKQLLKTRTLLHGLEMRRDVGEA